ncbi:hypothetical protein [Bradyrhizobium sp. USDA 4486]
MPDKGKPVDYWLPRSEADDYVRCTICREIFDMRELDRVLYHLHGQEVDFFEISLA